MRHLIVSLTLFIAGCVAPVDVSPTNTRPVDANRPVRVFIVAGQSNAVGYNSVLEYRNGRAKFPKELLHQPDVLFWRATINDQKQVGSWNKLSTAESGSFGPEISFARDMAKALSGEQIAIVKCAAGGTGIARSVDYNDYIPALKGFDDKNANWSPPSDKCEAGKLYESLIKNVHDAVAALDRDGRRWKLAGCLWMQGEHEAGISRKMAEDYGELLTGFIFAVRRDLQAPALPFAVGEINSHTWAYGDAARKKQAGVCRDDANAILVTTVDLSRSGSGGPAHFDADGMLTIGSRFADAARALGASIFKSADRGKTGGGGCD